MTTARKFFSDNVAVAGTTAVSMATLMKNAGWGFELDANNAITTQPSMDSFSGNGASIIPAADVYVGYDQYVRNADGVGPPRTYKGALAAAGLKFGIDDFCRGIVDPHAVWFYAAGGATTADLIFQGF